MEADAKAQLGPKKAQVGRKMAQDRVKMAKMGEDWREVSGRWLKMRRMSSKMRLKIVTMRFRSDFGGQNEKKKSVQGRPGSVKGLSRVRFGVPSDGMRGLALDYV